MCLRVFIYITQCFFDRLQESIEEDEGKAVKFRLSVVQGIFLGKIYMEKHTGAQRTRSFHRAQYWKPNKKLFRHNAKHKKVSRIPQIKKENIHPIARVRS